MSDVAGHPPRPAAPADPRRAVEVLVVDDEDATRELLAILLRESGYRVETADSAEEALALLRRRPFDLVLSDVQMPGASGLELSRILTHSHPHLPVVLITGHADVDTAREAVQIGAADYLTKPFTVESLAVAVERNLERRRLERERILEQDHRVMYRSIQALAAAIDAKQPLTAQHSERVVRLVERLCPALGLTGGEASAACFAAQVHDVGKIAVPDAVLEKAGPLTEEEWVWMRTHPARGAEIVGQIEELSFVADIVRHHHERIDGTGYPDGLAGESIPFLSRVIAVADAYEVMTSDRAYRARLPHAEAVRRLRECAGSQFDEGVVQVFCRLGDEGGDPFTGF